jgi:hypothetical protein
MPTTTRVNIRKALSQNTGDYHQLTTSAAGASDGSTLVDTSLRNLTGGGDDDGFLNQYVMITDTGSSADQEIRRIGTYDATISAPTMRFDETFSAQIATSITYELHRIDPSLKHIAIEQTANELFPFLRIGKRDETLIVDSVLLNGDFEDFTGGAPDNWTDENSATAAEENTRVFHLTSSLSLTGPAGDVGRRYQDLDININQIAGKTVVFKAWVWTDAASQARLVLNFGGTDTNGDYHDGDSEWQQLSVEAAVPTTATQVRVYCEVSANDTAYFDLAWAAIDPIYEYNLPDDIVRVTTVEQQWDETLIAGPYYPLLPGEWLKRGRIIRIRGQGPLSVPTTDTGTIEIGEPHLRLFAAYASLKLVEMLGEDSASRQIDDLERRMGRWERTIERLSRQPGLRQPPMWAKRGQNAWHIEDAPTRKLVFDANRSGALAFNTAIV